MKKKIRIQSTLTQDQLLAFHSFVKAVLELDALYQKAADYDGYEGMLNNLYSGAMLRDEEFERFHYIIQDANDPDCRCPK